MRKIAILALTSSLFFILSCAEKKKVPTSKIENPAMLDSLPGSCPYLTKDTKDNVVISWVKAVNDSNYIFCYAVSGDGGRSFDKKVIIPGSDNIHPHSENLPKIIFKPSGEIIALWGVANPNPKNKYSGVVLYCQSFDNGITWSMPLALVNDTAGYDQRYYDVALLPNGEAAIIWLDNRKTSDNEGSALYFASTEGNTGFRNEKIISEGCCQCCRTDLFIDSKAGIHVLYRGIIKDSIRDMLHSVSTDDGKNFSDPKLINNDNWVIKGCPHTGPSMTENENGLHFAWFTGGPNKGCFYTRSKDNGNSFVHNDRISLKGSHPQIASLPDGKLITTWDESVQVNSKYYKRIGVQLRSAEGVNERLEFITADTITSTYPVLMPVSNKESAMAWSVNRDGKEFIQYQRIRL